MIKDVRIPEARRAALIGKGGRTKAQLQKKTGTRINISDVIEISGEPLDVLAAENVVKAIGRGFAPNKAVELLDEDKLLHIIEIPEKGLERIRARLIGRFGKARRKIEWETGARLSVYGKTVSVIGDSQAVDVATAAVEKIIKGAPHRNAYRMIKRLKRG